MNVLAFDTCLGAVSAAVSRTDDRGSLVVRDAWEMRTTGHAERLMPMIGEVMAAAGASFRDIDRIAVTAGPGTFTGVRVGVAAARALALAMERPLVAATSLAVMAHRAGVLLGEARAGRQLAVAVDARRGMVFFQLFGEDCRALSAPMLLEPTDAAALVGAQPAVVVGSAAAVVGNAVMAAGGSPEVALADLQPHARSLLAQAGDLIPVSPLKPLYLRPPDVKPQGDQSLARAAP